MRPVRFVRTSASAVLTGEGPLASDDDLLAFLDAVDDTIPVSRRVLAVVDARPASGVAVAAPWLAEHPRRDVRSAMSHASWVSEVDGLP
jgi:hypothetical protein